MRVNVKGSRILAKYAHDVRVWSYPAEIDGQPVKSYVVEHRGAQVQRFLHLDLGAAARDMANAFAAGYATALARCRTNPEAYRWIRSLVVNPGEWILFGPSIPRRTGVPHRAATIFAPAGILGLKMDDPDPPGPRTWHTWDFDGVGGENSTEHTLERAKVEALAAVLRWAAWATP